MKAFHGSEEIKADLIQRLQFHYDQDNLVKGQYWEHGKGCAIGCALSRYVPHGSWHSSYEIQFGIPEILARLQDKIFESLPNENAKEWPLGFTKAINAGSDLSKVWQKFAIWLLTDKAFGVIQFAETELSQTAIEKIVDLYTRQNVTTGDWDLAISDAYDACFAADADADAYHSCAAYAAYAAAHAAHAAYAAYAAAHADASDDFFHCVTCTSYAANAYAVAEKHYIAQSKKLIQLLEEAK